jgi:hypothetical protein
MGGPQSRDLFLRIRDGLQRELLVVLGLIALPFPNVIADSLSMAVE